MSICRHCANDNPADAQFCITCSKPLSTRDAVGGVNTPPLDGSRSGSATLHNLGEDLPAGTLVARRYTVNKLISGNSLSKVYYATEVLGGKEQPVALKVFRNGPPLRAGAIDTVFERAMANQAIRHRNVVAVRNVGRFDDNCAFVAMELVSGLTLRQFIRQKLEQRMDAPLAAAVAIVRSILDGLEAGHSAGLVHGGLEPDKIFLTGNAGADQVSVTLLSFGLSSTDLFDLPFAAAPYLAPEWRSEAETPSASADLYSLSVIFYEMLMGVFPVGHWQPPSSARSDVPEAIDTLIKQGLSARWPSRPQSAVEYRALLDAALAQSASAAQQTHASAEQSAGPEMPPKPAITGRETVAKGTMLIAPKKDAQGNWYMPEMVDKNGKRTKWSWWAGYMGANFK